MSDTAFDFRNADCLRALEDEDEPLGIDLLVTSPPYNIGKSYETDLAHEDYVRWQTAVLRACMRHMSPTGHVVYQVGHHVRNRVVLPLDYEFIPILLNEGLKLRNRIIWTFGSGLHAKHRFSGRHETILWTTVGDDYKCDTEIGRFNDPLAPEDPRFSDVWDDITNVKGNHREKTKHPCQYPVGLAERLVLALTDEDALVCDPFAGVASAGVAAVANGRRFIGFEIDRDYHETGTERLVAAEEGRAVYRPHDMGTWQPGGGYRHA